MLKIIKHEQHPPLGERRDKPLEARLFGRRGQPEGVGERDEHELGVGEVSEGDKGNAIGESGRKLGGSLERQPRLATATGASQREQTVLGEKPGNRGEISGSSDQRREWARQRREFKRQRGRREGEGWVALKGRSKRGG